MDPSLNLVEHPMKYVRESTRHIIKEKSKVLGDLKTIEKFEYCIS